MSRWVYVSLAALSLGLLLIDAAPALSVVLMAGAVAVERPGTGDMRRWQNETRCGCPDLLLMLVALFIGIQEYIEDRMDKKYEHIEAVPTVEDCEEMLARKGMRTVIRDGKVVRFIEDDEVE